MIREEQCVTSFPLFSVSSEKKKVVHKNRVAVCAQERMLTKGKELPSWILQLYGLFCKFRVCWFGCFWICWTKHCCSNIGCTSSCVKRVRWRVVMSSLPQLLQTMFSFCYALFVPNKARVLSVRTLAANLVCFGMITHVYILLTRFHKWSCSNCSLVRSCWPANFYFERSSVYRFHLKVTWQRTGHVSCSPWQQFCCLSWTRTHRDITRKRSREVRASCVSMTSCLYESSAGQEQELLLNCKTLVAFNASRSCLYWGMFEMFRWLFGGGSPFSLWNPVSKLVAHRRGSQEFWNMSRWCSICFVWTNTHGIPMRSFMWKPLNTEWQGSGGWKVSLSI